MQVFRIKDWLEGFLHQFRIRYANTTTQNCTNVTENRFANLIGQLRHELVRQNKVQTIFTSFRKNWLKAFRRKVLELIHEETEILTFIFWRIGTTHSCRLELHHENHTKKLCVQFAGFTLRQVDKQNLFIVHDFANVKARFWLTQNITHHLVRQEWTPLRYEPARHLTGIIRFLRSWKFLRPIIINRLISNILQLRFHKFWINETTRNINESTTLWVTHQ